MPIVNKSGNLSSLAWMISPIIVGFLVGLAISSMTDEPTEKVFTAKVVKINDRLALDGADQTIVPFQWVKLVEGDTHCVRINYDADGFVSRVDVSNPGAKCND